MGTGVTLGRSIFASFKEGMGCVCGNPACAKSGRKRFPNVHIVMTHSYGLKVWRIVFGELGRWRPHFPGMRQYIS